MNGRRQYDGFRAVRELYNAYAPKLDSTHGGIAIDGFLLPAVLETVRARTGRPDYSITLQPRAWSGKTFKAVLTRYESHAIVYYNMGENVCWRRFLIAKELAHLLVDDGDGAFQTDIDAAIEGLASGFRLPSAAWMESEHVAAIAAMELMMPWQFHSDIMDMDESADTTYFEIARKFRVPERMVQIRQLTEYLTACIETNEQIDRELALVSGE